MAICPLLAHRPVTLPRRSPHDAAEDIHSGRPRADCHLPLPADTARVCHGKPLQIILRAGCAVTIRRAHCMRPYILLPAFRGVWGWVEAGVFVGDEVGKELGGVGANGQAAGAVAGADPAIVGPGQPPDRRDAVRAPRP